MTRFSPEDSRLSQTEMVELSRREMSKEDLALYDSFKHGHSDAAFLTRALVVFRMAGKDRLGRHLPPKRLAEVQVVDLEVSTDTGFKMTLDLVGQDRHLIVEHTPVRLFDFPAFISVPLTQRVELAATAYPGGYIKRRLIWGVGIKQKTKPEFNVSGTICVLTQTRYSELFPGG